MLHLKTNLFEIFLEIESTQRQDNLINIQLLVSFSDLLFPELNSKGSNTYVKYNNNPLTLNHFDN